MMKYKDNDSKNETIATDNHECQPQECDNVNE